MCSSPVAVCSGLGTSLGATIKYVRFVSQAPAAQWRLNRRRNGGSNMRPPYASVPPKNTIKYVRETASGAAGNDLGKTIKYLRRTRNGAAGNGLGITIKYL
jgi:hypothetical protein